MRHINDFLVLSLLALPMCAPSAIAATMLTMDAAEKCDQFSQSDRRDCLDKLAADSAVLLKKAEAKAASAIAAWDEDSRYIRAAKSRLDASALSFARYRKAHCAFATSLRGGAAGDAHEISRLACIADTNASRVIELDRETANLPSK